MKKILSCMLAGWIAPGFVGALAQGAAPEQQAAALKQKWTKALTEAVQEFQNNNDQESASFASGILASLDQPGGMTPAALAANGQRMKDRVRQLVRRGALASAADLNWAQWQALNKTVPEPKGPANPNHKAGGVPGPGGLVLYLSFDKPDEGGAVRDESGAGNGGRVFGAQWISDGKFGGAYQFHITNLTDRIVIPNSDTLNPDYVTVSAWIKAADRDGFFNRIVDKHCNNGYCLDLGGDYNGKMHRGKLQLELGLGYLEQPDRPLNDNQWHFVAGTYDGKTLRCYVDNMEKSSVLRNSSPLRKNTWDVCIGNTAIDYGTGEFLGFDGLIDEVRIYNRALSGDEIRALATATHAGADLLPPTAGAVGKPDAATRLKEVKSLLDQGLINKDAYDKKVKEIMDSL
jgi:hypothetical protein